MPNAIYQRAWKLRNPERVAAHNEARRRKHALERGYVSLVKVCANPECRALFEAKRIDARTCSRRCRSRVGQIRRTARNRAA